MTATRRAAVLVPFHRDDADRLRVVLVRRTDRGRHGGQIALPGGIIEPTDSGPREAAVRETCEELGLAADGIEVLDALATARTRTTGYLVHPFVAGLHGLGSPPAWHPQPEEVAEVLDVPVRDLVAPAAAGQRTMSWAGWTGPRRVPVRLVQGHVMWGLTLRILEPVLTRVLAGEWPV